MTPQELMILRELQDIKHRQSWWLDLSSNVVGNYIADASIWLLSSIIRKF